MRVLESADLGLRDSLENTVCGIALGARPEDHQLVDHQLVAGLLHSGRGLGDSDRQWLGITVDDPSAGGDDPDLRAEQPSAEVAWFLDETDGTGLGITDLP